MVLLGTPRGSAAVQVEASVAAAASIVLGTASSRANEGQQQQEQQQRIASDTSQRAFVSESRAERHAERFWAGIAATIFVGKLENWMRGERGGALHLLRGSIGTHGVEILKECQDINRGQPIH